MKARFFVSAVVAAGLAGCATDYVPPRPVAKPGPEYDTRNAYVPGREPGLFGDLTWNIGGSQAAKPAAGAAAVPPAAAAAAPRTTTEQEDFKKWQESAGSKERQEFEDWRAWQEWKRKNPK